MPAKRKERRESALLSVISEDDGGGGNGGARRPQSTAGLSSVVDFEKKVSLLGRVIFCALETFFNALKKRKRGICDSSTLS